MERTKRRKPKAQRKELVIPVRVSAEQKEALMAKAQRRGLGVSTWLLQLGMTAPDQPPGSER
jgi:hypothetical protein